MIGFNLPLLTGREQKYLKKVLKNKSLSGDYYFSQKCSLLLEKILKCKKVMLVPSGTAALEMAAILADIQRSDEVIMPSYTFTSTANAFVLRGAKIVFVDIRPDTMNIDENLIEKAITKKTKVIVPVHYGGVGCDMEKIMDLARQYHLFVVEDAAQAIAASYKGRYLGTIGEMGCLSFHESKNITCGEGGAILLNNPKLIERAEIIREKGTNRKKFFQGKVDKYTWVDIGASYLLSELNAAFLLAQLERIATVTRDRVRSWNMYHKLLKPLMDKGLIDLPKIPSKCEHNGHIFYIKTKNLKERTRLIDYLKKHKISAVFHYIPLHSSPAGKKFGRFSGRDLWTTKESERILRLPMHYDMGENDVKKIVKTIERFYQK